MPQTPSQAAASLFALLTEAMPAPFLEDYGLEGSPEQIRQVSREVLALNLYWARHALTTVLSSADGGRVFEALTAMVLAQWPETPGLKFQTSEGFLEQAAERRETYERIVQEGGSPLAVFTETVEILESAGGIGAEERQKMLALLIDLVPVEAIGDFVSELDLAHK